MPTEVMEALESDTRASGVARVTRAVRGHRSRKWTKLHKPSTLSSQALSSSTTVHVTRSELPQLRRSSSFKRPDHQNPPAKCLHANTHKMSTARLKQHRHATPPSRIDPPVPRHWFSPAPAFHSLLLRATTPTQVPIHPGIRGEKAPQRKVSSDTGQRTAGSQHCCNLPKVFRGCRRRSRPVGVARKTATGAAGCHSWDTTAAHASSSGDAARVDPTRRWGQSGGGR